MVTPKTVKTVLKMNEDGVDKSEIAMKCDISIQSVEDILKNSNKNKLHVSEEKRQLTVRATISMVFLICCSVRVTV